MRPPASMEDGSNRYIPQKKIKILRFYQIFFIAIIKNPIYYGNTTRFHTMKTSGFVMRFRTLNRERVDAMTPISQLYRLFYHSFRAERSALCFPAAKRNQTAMIRDIARFKNRQGCLPWEWRFVRDGWNRGKRVIHRVCVHPLALKLIRPFQHIRSDIFNIIEGIRRPEMRPLLQNYYLPLPRWNPAPLEDAFQALQRAPARLSAGLRDVLSLLKLVTPQQVVRLAMIYAMILGMVSLNRIPLNRPVKTPEFPQEIETAQADTEEAGDVDEGGMGMTYLDAAMPVNFEPAETGGAPLGGVPEPLEYSKPQVLLYTSYKIGPGDTIGRIAGNFGLNQDTIISINTIRNSRSLQIGQILNVPNQDGILYTVKKGDTLDRITKKYQVEITVIQTVNELFSSQVNSGSTLFIPGARLDAMDLQEINGDLFVWPLRGYITSLYGYRSNPFTKRRQFHTGLDIAAPMGTPIKAAMGGRVSSVGYNESTGNHVVITHHSGYRTLYGHMSIIRVKSGAYVKAGDRIGDVGSTGLSTGPHLHFTVYKNGVTVNPWALLN